MKQYNSSVSLTGTSLWLERYLQSQKSKYYLELTRSGKTTHHGEFEDFQRVSGTDREFFVVMSNEQGIKALFRASLMLNAVEFQYVLDDKHVFVQEGQDADAS